MSKKLFFNITVLISIILIIFTSIYLNRDTKVGKHFTYEYAKGRVLDITDQRIEPHDLYPNRKIGRQDLVVKIITGKYKGKVINITNFISAERNLIMKKNMVAIFTLREGNGHLESWLYAYESEKWIYIVCAIFIIILIALSGRRGLESILALVFTSTMIFFVLIPLLFTGRDPIIYSILVTIIITGISMILVGGFDKKTLVAILGTTSGIITAGIMAYTFGSLAKLSNIFLDYGDQLLYLTAKFPIKLDGLIFTGILIASLGAVMDVAMSISSAIFELTSTTILSKKSIFMSAMNIGRDIMGTMTNTLILAFTGGALNLLLMIWGFRMNYTQVMNKPVFATEILQALSGSIGIILTVPFTAIIAAYIYTKKSKK